MILKPKNTVLNTRALLYKRFNDKESAFIFNWVDTNAYYKGVENGVTKYYKLVNYEFVNATPTSEDIVIDIMPSTAEKEIYYTVKDGTNSYMYKYLPESVAKWSRSNLNLLTARFSNVATVQTNKYFYYASFNYVKKGSVEGSITQQVKGNMLPLENFEIQHFDDGINLRVSDLVVINNRLYSVENPTVDHKHLPKDYTIYTATLNSIV